MDGEWQACFSPRFDRGRRTRWPFRGRNKLVDSQSEAMAVNRSLVMPTKLDKSPLQPTEGHPIFKNRGLFIRGQHSPTIAFLIPLDTCPRVDHFFISIWRLALVVAMKWLHGSCNMPIQVSCWCPSQNMATGLLWGTLFFTQPLRRPS